MFRLLWDILKNFFYTFYYIFILVFESYVKYFRFISRVNFICIGIFQLYNFLYQNLLSTPFCEELKEEK